MNRSEFAGVIGRYHWDSEPWWPDPPRPPDGAPNIVVLVLDDVGFAQVGCFGSDIATPTLDALAAGGLRYANFHTTALCSPTRACLLTGRNHHSNGMGRIIELAMGFPGYDTRIPETNGLLPAMLTPHGYAAWAVGKWHLTPEDEAHLGAPRVRWPLGRGFERFYGFMGGETHQFAPELFHDNHQVAPPRSYVEGYHLTEDLVDRSIEFVDDLRAVDPGKPFFLYLATGACHSPHQSPADWVARYRGQFDEGWDVWRERAIARQVESGLLPPDTELSPRPEWVPAWADLGNDERRVYARFMEAFAGFLSHTDDQIGRLVEHLRSRGELDNTLVLALSDNGASSEGGPLGSLNDARTWNIVPRDIEEAVARIDEIGGPTLHNNYPWGWTVAGNTPFRRWKREVHEGGVADPLIVHWPAGIPADDTGTVRRQYVHAIDLVPTILETIGVEAPTELGGVEQRPIEGVSFAATFTDARAPDRHTTQYYEMFGCRAIYHEGWKAVTYHQIQFEEPGLDQAPWELYDVRVDPSECHDLADEHPERLEELIELWWGEAERYDVLPVDNRPFSDLVFGRPPGTPPRGRYEYFPDRMPVPEAVAVNVRNRSHRVVVDIEVPDGAEGELEGVLIAQGSNLGGWALYLEDGEVRYVHNLSGRTEDRVRAPVELAPGSHVVGFRFDKDEERFGGTGTLVVDGDDVASSEIPMFTPHRFSLTGAGLTVGYQPEFATTDDIEAPFRFTGAIHRAVIEVDGEPYLDPEHEANDAIARQ